MSLFRFDKNTNWFVKLLKITKITIHELFGLLFPDFAVKLMIDEQSPPTSNQQSKLSCTL
jgi:hypothetical protein